MGTKSKPYKDYGLGKPSSPLNQKRLVYDGTAHSFLLSAWVHVGESAQATTARENTKLLTFVIRRCQVGKRVQVETI